MSCIFKYHLTTATWPDTETRSIFIVRCSRLPTHSLHVHKLRDIGLCWRCFREFSKIPKFSFPVHFVLSFRKRLQTNKLYSRRQIFRTACDKARRLWQIQRYPDTKRQDGPRINPVDRLRLYWITVGLRMSQTTTMPIQRNWIVQCFLFASFLTTRLDFSSVITPVTCIAKA